MKVPQLRPMVFQDHLKLFRLKSWSEGSFLCTNCNLIEQIVWIFGGDIGWGCWSFCMRASLQSFQLGLKYICPKCKMYFSKLTNIFGQITICICSNCKIILFKLQNVFACAVVCRVSNLD